MIELKAELMKKKKEYEETKKQKSIKPIKKLQNESEPERKRSEISHVEEDLLKRSREALEAKSRLYSRLERGKLMESDLSSGQRENLMVDFAWKGWNPETEDFDFDHSEDDDSDKEEGNGNPLKMDQVIELLNNTKDETKWIEYEDEFGRTRVTKLSQLVQIQKERQEVQSAVSSSTSHYDGDAEIRNKGVGFYQFARDEEERKRQMGELRKLREETVEKRMRNLILKEERRLRIESRLKRLKNRE